MKSLPLRTDVTIPLPLAASDMGAKVSGALPSALTGVSLDTRTIQKGDLFFALKAERDAHDFVSQAFEKGAIAAVVSRDVAASGPLLRVEDTLKALGDLALGVRRRWAGPVIGISGSNGKTTTKEMTAALLSGSQSTLKTQGTWNNHLGVPLTLLGLLPKHQAVVLEMGINDFGEMAGLCRVAEPTIGILTSIGPVHLQRLGSVDGVARAKGELFDSLPQKGTAIVNIDDLKIRGLAEKLRCRKVTISLNDHADLTAKVVRDLGNDGLELQVKYGSEVFTLRTPFIGIHNVYNLLCGMGAAYALGISPSTLEAGLARVDRPEMRLQVIELARQVRVINDCYNANPASTMVALDTAAQLAGGRVMAALGDMMELGDFAPRAHRDIGIKAALLKYDRLFVLGQFSGDLMQGAVQGGMSPDRIFVGDSHEHVAEAIARLLQPGDTLLVKGSRGARMEKVTESLQTKWKEVQI